MDKNLHPRYDTGRLYMSRKEGGSGYSYIEDYIEASVQKLEQYIKKIQEKLITEQVTEMAMNGKQEKLENRNKEKNNCMDISSEKLGWWHTRNAWTLFT